MKHMLSMNGKIRLALDSRDFDKSRIALSGGVRVVFAIAALAGNGGDGLGRDRRGGDGLGRDGLGRDGRGGEGRGRFLADFWRKT